jgi:hypothetical protein
MVTNEAITAILQQLEVLHGVLYPEADVNGIEKKKKKKKNMNLLDNCKTDMFRLLCFKFLALGNGDDNNIPKLPKECL